MSVTTCKPTRCCAWPTSWRAWLIAHMPRAIGGTVLDPKLVQPLIDAAAKYGAIPATFNAADIIAPGAT